MELEVTKKKAGLPFRLLDWHQVQRWTMRGWKQDRVWTGHFGCYIMSRLGEPCLLIDNLNPGSVVQAAGRPDGWGMARSTQPVGSSQVRNECTTAGCSACRRRSQARTHGTLDSRLALLHVSLTRQDQAADVNFLPIAHQRRLDRRWCALHTMEKGAIPTGTEARK